MTLIEKYESAVLSNDIVDDESQRKIITSLQKITDDLETSTPWYKSSSSMHISGLYMVGRVGVGKTYLMDLFYNNLPEKKKARFHFHHFMQQVDKKLRELQGHADPLFELAKQLSKDIRVLCLDEFLVSDVAYAMILAQLLTAIFKHNIVLVITTNTLVDDLYQDGVGRERFLPAIDLLKENCRVACLTGNHDYRIGRGQDIKSYLFPLNNSTTNDLNAQFQQIVTDEIEQGEICVLNRPIAFVKSGEGAIWFEFDILCDVPRCQLDYLEIVMEYNTIFITNIPVLTAHDTIKVLLFMHFVDVAYDRGVRLFLSAEVSAESLYTSGELLQPFSRTVSRLEEMQSMDYLKRHTYLNSKLEIN
jgi:cell division protein ZapE